MATKQTIFEFDATQSIDNLRNLRAEIKELKAAMEELEIGSEEYNETSDRLYAKQQRLAELMREHKQPVEDVAGSFNELNAKLRELKEEWKATGDEVERAALTEKINAVKGQMNAMNESIGNYQHNVGNYTNSIIDAFTQMGFSASKLTEPLEKLGVDLGGVSSTLKLLSMALKMSQGANMEALKSGFAAATSAVDKFTKSLAGVKAAVLATGIGALLVALAAVVAAWDDIKDAIGETESATDSLINATNDFIDAQNEALDGSSRLEKLMRKLGATELQIAARRALNLKLAVNEANVKIAEQKATLAELNSWWVKVQRTLAAIAKYLQYILPGMGSIAEMGEYYDQVEEGATQSLKDLEEQYKKLKEEYQDALTDLAGAAIDSVKDDDDKVKKVAKATKDELEKLFQEMKGEAEKEMELMQTALDKALEIRQQAIDAQKTAKEKEIESYREQLAQLEEWGISTEELTANHNKKMAELAEQEVQQEQKKAEAKKKLALELLEFQEQMREKEQERQGETELSDWDYDAIVERNNAEFEAAKALNDAKISLNVELMQSYEETSEEYQRLLRENELLAAETSVKQAQRDKANTEAYQKLMKARVAASKSMVNSTQDLLKGLSAAMGENTKMGKGFAIANATIDTIQASIAGFKAGYNQWKDAGPMAWMAPVQGAINAAAALVAGFAQVQKIRNVDVSGNDGGSSGGMATALAMPNIEGLSSPIDYTRQVTTETEREEMNRDSRVYILESDIQDSGRRVKVREEETTF